MQNTKKQTGKNQIIGRFLDLIVLKETSPEAREKWERVNEGLEKLPGRDLAILEDTLNSRSVRSIAKAYRMGRPAIERSIENTAKLLDKLMNQYEV